MKFGIPLPALRPTPDIHWEPEATAQAAIAVAQRADSLGFDYVSVADHIILPASLRRQLGRTWYNPTATLAYVAGATKRVRLMAGVSVLPYRSPFLVAKEFATLDVLSRGRVVLGAGVGYLQPEFQTLRVAYEHRGAMCDEVVQLLRRLFTEESVTHEGRFYRCDNMVLDPRPVQSPLPIWVGGSSKAAARRAFTLGDGWMPVQVTDADFQEQREHGRQAAIRSGRKSSMAICAQLGPIDLTGRAPAASRESADRQIDVPGGSAAYRERVAQGAVATLATPEEALARVDQLRRMGVTHATVQLAFRELPELLDSMERFAEDVMAKAGA